jgi:FkbM family methyltransferase
MNLLKKIIPNNVKQEGKYLLYNLLNIPYNKFGIHTAITQWMPIDKPITLMDIGASEGNFSFAISRLYKIKRAVLVEPIPARLPHLNTLFPDNKFEILNLAVSDKEGEAEFYISDYDVLSSLFKIKDDHNNHFNIGLPVKAMVKTSTLDKISSQSRLNEIDLIKVDVQGAEHLVLQSGLETLKRTKLVFTEFSYKPMYDGSSTFFDIYTILNHNNFRLVNVSEAYKLANGEIIQGDALFINNAFC